MGIDAGRAIDLSGIVSRPASAGSPRTSAGESSLTLPGLALQADESTFSTVIEISATVPVVVCFVHDLAADEAMIRTLTDAVTALAGKTILVSVDAQANPQLVGSFRVDAIAAAEGGASPVVAAVIGGRPLPLFAGTQSAEAIAQLLQQLAVAGLGGTAEAQIPEQVHTGWGCLWTGLLGGNAVAHWALSLNRA
ncbi:MAG: hypothetical protein EBR52_05620 [Microbacteriaceae bacterium]|nr:hypothetical protein [Microbacteriaceae bacterium]